MRRKMAAPRFDKEIGQDFPQMVAFFAFLHHIAAFALVAALTVELALTKGELTLQSARKIPLYDLVFGIAASVVLIVGLLRVFYFEKGADYYFHNAAFHTKLSLYVIVASSLSILRSSFCLGESPYDEDKFRRSILANCARSASFCIWNSSVSF